MVLMGKESPGRCTAAITSAFSKIFQLMPGSGMRPCNKARTGTTSDPAISGEGGKMATGLLAAIPAQAAAAARISL